MKHIYTCERDRFKFVSPAPSRRKLEFQTPRYYGADEFDNDDDAIKDRTIFA